MRAVVAAPARIDCFADGIKIVNREAEFFRKFGDCGVAFGYPFAPRFIGNNIALFENERGVGKDNFAILGERFE